MPLLVWAHSPLSMNSKCLLRRRPLLFAAGQCFTIIIQINMKMAAVAIGILASLSWLKSSLLLLESLLQPVLRMRKTSDLILVY